VNEKRPNVLDYAPGRTPIAWRALAIKLLTILAITIAFILIQVLVVGGIGYLTSLWA
jgi:hypothetical protein